jgi:rod shape-determining protein MreC
MNAVTATRRTLRREWTSFGVLLIVSVGLMGISDTSTVHDLQSAVYTVAGPIMTVVNDASDTAGSYWSALTQIDRLRSQNDQLKQENLTLQEELDRMGAISKLNDDWTKITAAQESVPYQTTPVRVIVRDLSNVGQQTLIISKGSNDGIVVGQTVIDAGGALVGRIATVEATVSTILLISDPTSVVVGKEAISGATGTIYGSVSGNLQMSYVDVSVDVAVTLKGRAVVTAGESLPNTTDISPYPPGLLIGTITSVKPDPNLVVQSATITPAAHLTDATFLLVIVDYRGGFGPAIPSGCITRPAGTGKTATPTRTAAPNPSTSPSAGSTLFCPPIFTAGPSGSVKPTATPGPTATPVPVPTPSQAPSPSQ